MRVTVFVGPSLTREERRGAPEIDWRPPVEAGDLLRLIDDPPDTICLIDGYFDQRPAVRHKEILLLLSRGMRILGASSIGALRAAEMDGFGMIGVGAIYAAYRDGVICGDDEVALLHAPAELDWRPLSLPLVEVRATLDLARARAIISVAQQRSLQATATTIFYQDRDWAMIVAHANAQGTSPLLLDWLVTNHVAQKVIDARACIAAALAGPSLAIPPPEAIMPGFVAALARDCGLSTTSVPQAQRAAAPISSRAAPHPGTDSET